MQLPLLAANADRNLKQIGRPHFLSGVIFFLNGRGQREFINFEKTIRANIAKQKPDEILITFLAVHDAEIPEWLRFTKACGD
jgi:hypothetical protein